MGLLSMDRVVVAGGNRAQAACDNGHNRTFKSIFGKVYPHCRWNERLRGANVAWFVVSWQLRPDAKHSAKRLVTMRQIRVAQDAHEPCGFSRLADGIG